MVMVERDVSLSEMLIIVRSSDAKAAAIPREIAPVYKSFVFISYSDLLSSYFSMCLDFQDGCDEQICRYEL